MKYIRAEFPEPSQCEIPDDVADLWRKNGNTNISDEPWPGLPIVTAYIVTETDPAEEAA